MRRALTIATAAGVAALLGATTGTGASSACSTRNSGTVIVSADTGAVTCRTASRLLPAVADGRGGWFGVVATRSPDGPQSIVRLRRDGSLDPRWRVPLPASAGVTALVVQPPFLYAGGAFGIASFSSWTGKRLWRIAVRRAPSASYDVAQIALVADASTLYAGGDFVRVAGVKRRGLVAIDARTGRVRLQPAFAFSAGRVSALALAGTNLFVGYGDLSAFDARSGRRLSWHPQLPVGDAETLLVAHGFVFSAGHDGFAITDIRTGLPSPWTVRPQNRPPGEARICCPDTFGAQGSIVYLGVSSGRHGFAAVDGKPRANLAALDLAARRVIPWAPHGRAVMDPYGVTGTPVPSGDRVLLVR